MLWVDALHGGAHADHRCHKLNGFVEGFHLGRQAFHQVQFGPHQPTRRRLRFFDFFHNKLGGAHEICRFAHVKITFGVGNHVPFGVFFAEGIDLRFLEHLMHRAVAIPQQNFRFFNV